MRACASSSEWSPVASTMPCRAHTRNSGPAQWWRISNVTGFHPLADHTSKSPRARGVASLEPCQSCQVRPSWTAHSAASSSMRTLRGSQQCSRTTSGVSPVTGTHPRHRGAAPQPRRGLQPCGHGGVPDLQRGRGVRAGLHPRRRGSGALEPLPRLRVGRGSPRAEQVGAARPQCHRGRPRVRAVGRAAHASLRGAGAALPCRPRLRD